MRHNWIVMAFVLVLSACRPQQEPEDLRRSQSGLQSENAPNRADPPQNRATAGDPTNPQQGSGISGTGTAQGSGVSGTAPGSSGSGIGTSPPTAEQVNDAMAACGRMPADQQEACRARIAPAAPRADENKDR